MLDVVAVSSPGIGISIPAGSVFQACCHCSSAVVGWTLWSQEPSLFSATTVSTSRNHLTVVVNGRSYPIFSDQDLLVLVPWTKVPSLSTSSPVDPLTGAHWEGLAVKEHLEECKHRRWSGWSQGPDPPRGEKNYLSSIGLVGGMYGWFTNSKLPNCLVFLASHKV